MQDEDHSLDKWRSAVPNIIDPPPPFSGGKRPGYISRNNKLIEFKLRMRACKITRSWRITEHGEERAWSLAKEFAQKWCEDHDLCRNQTRFIAPGVVEMKLTQGLTTIFEERNLQLVLSYTWRACRMGNVFYVRGTTYGGFHQKQNFVSLHRVISNLPDDLMTDHLDGNGLNNLSANLLPSTASQNQHNNALNIKNTSGTNGVHRNIVIYRSGRQAVFWKASWMENGKTVSKAFRVREDDIDELSAKRQAIAERAASDLRLGNKNGFRPKRNGLDE